MKESRWRWLARLGWACAGITVAPGAPASAQTPDIRLAGLGRISAVYDLEVSGSHLYALERGRIRVLFLDEHQQFPDVAAVELEAPRARIARLGSRLYLSGFGAPLGIVDITDPAAPEWVGEWGGFVGAWTDGLEIEGGLGYLVTRNPASELALEVLDLEATSEARRLLGRAPLGIRAPGVTGGLYVVGSTAFVLVPGDGTQSHLIEVNASDPSAPVEARRYRLPAGARFVDVHVTDSLIVLLRNDTVRAITVFGRREGPDIELMSEVSDREFFAPMDLLSVGPVVYATFKGTVDLVAVDLSDARSPRVVLRHTIPDLWAAGLGMTVANARLYVAGDGGPSPVFDVSDPLMTSLIGYWDFQGGLAGSIASTDSLTLVGNVGGGYFVFDTSNPRAPRRLARVTMDRDPPTDAWQPTVTPAVYGRRAVVAYERGSAEVVDLSDPAHPRVVSRFTPAGLVLVARLTETHAYLGSRQAAAGRAPDFYDETSLSRAGALEVIDVRDPEAPRSVALVEFETAVTDLDVVDSLLLIVHADGSLSVLDVVDPARPFLVGRWEGEGVVDPYATRTGRLAHNTNSSKVAITHRTSDWRTHLTLLDLREPSRPRRLGTLALPAQRFPGTLVGMQGDFVLLFNGDLTLVDTRDASHPRVVLTRPLPVTEAWLEDEWFDLSVKDGFGFLSMHERGLWIFELDLKP